MDSWRYFSSLDCRVRVPLESSIPKGVVSMEQPVTCEPIANASAIILSGGKSSRMGRPKALLPFDGVPLIVHIVHELKRLFAETVVVAAPGQELPVLPAQLVRDEVPYQGPVGGIYYGLKAASGEFSFVTSCDVAFVNLGLISHLFSRIADCDVAVPYWNERLQPLHAVYRRRVLPILKGQLDRQELRPVFLYDKVKTNKVEEAEVRRFDPEGLSFFNMNTPEDYKQALDRWRQLREKSTKDTGTRATRSAGLVILVTVELFGVPRLLAKTTAISLTLPQDATLAHVYSALAERLPMLVGRVINSDRQSLSRGYSCNLNGLEFVKNATGKIHSGDRIFILSADAGG